MVDQGAGGGDGQECEGEGFEEAEAGEGSFHHFAFDDGLCDGEAVGGLVDVGDCWCRCVPYFIKVLC